MFSDVLNIALCNPETTLYTKIKLVMTEVFEKKKDNVYY